MNPLLRAFQSVRSRQLSVFLFHEVLEKSNPLAPGYLNLEIFTDLIDFIVDNFHVIPLEDAARRVESGRLPDSAACITFDDGYPGWVANALPILETRGVHATFFVTTGQLHGQPLWHERISNAIRQGTEALLHVPGLGIPDFPLRNVAEKATVIDVLERYLKYQSLESRERMLRQLEDWAGCTPQGVPNIKTSDIRTLHSRGFGIGAHTILHPILSRCSDKEAMHEIAGSAEALAGIVGGPVRAFAYPNGRRGADFSSAHVRMVRKAGYTCAVTTDAGAARERGSTFLLPRFTPWGPSRSRMGWQMARNLLKGVSSLKADPQAAFVQRDSPKTRMKVAVVENGAGFGGAVVALRTLLMNCSGEQLAFHVVTNLPVGDFRQAEAVDSQRVLNDCAYNFRPLAKEIRSLRLGFVGRLILFLVGRADDLVNRLPHLVRLFMYCLRLRPDIIHGNNEPNSNREAMLVAKLLGVPYVQHVRGPVGEARHTPWLLARPNAFIPVSRWLASELLTMGVAPDRIHQIYDAVQLNPVADFGGNKSLRHEFSVSDDAVVVAMVGNLVRWKGQQLFVDAVQRYESDGGEVKFLVVGGVPERGDYTYEAELKAMAGNMGLDDRLLFTGHRDDLIEMLREIDIVVSASLQPEPLGLVMLEAMTSGCIFVGPCFGAATEVVTDGRNGFLFTPNSAQSLSDKLAEAVALARIQPRQARLGQAEAIMRQFGGDECANATLTVYRQVAASIAWSAHSV